MTSVPIPVVVALLLVMLIAMNRQLLNETTTGRLFVAVLYAYALSMVLIGLRWSLDLMWLMRFASVLAVISTVLLYLAFRSLGRVPAFAIGDDWPILIPIAVITIISAFNPTWTDPALVVIKLLFAALLIQLARQSPVSLQLARLDWLRNTERALWFAALLLLGSAVIDVAIAIDFAVNDGRFAASIVGTVNLLSVFIIGWAAVQAGRGSVDPDKEQSVATDNNSAETAVSASEDEAADRSLLDELNNLLVDQKFFADTNLNLQKLARKAGHPPRTISRVVNQLTGQNVSQWVNAARVNAACTLLKNADIAVTDAMHEAGFSTKSNFNREFKRVTGHSPSDWRRQNTTSSESTLYR